MANVLFLQKVWSENLGPMYLSSKAKTLGHKTNVLIDEQPSKHNLLQSFKPTLIAFSLTTGTHLWALEQARAIKASYSVPVIFGGAHPTYFPEVIEHPGVDIICRGEGDGAFPELLAALDEGRDYRTIDNLWVKTNGAISRNPMRSLIHDLDSIPFPDRELYYQFPFLRSNPTKAFISGRGCPYSCSYCSTATLRELYRGRGVFTRFREPDKVIAEIKAVREQFGLNTVCFQDDTFILKPSRLRPLLKLYGTEIGLPFICHVRADLVTEEIVRLLKESGCHSVDFGLESGNQERRRQLLCKTVSNDDIWRAAVLFRTYRIPFRTTNMLGLPGETLDTALETVRLNQRIKTNYPSCSVYQPYPRTELGDKVIAAGLAGADYDVDRIAPTFYKTTTFKTAPAQRFANLQKFFTVAVKFPAMTGLIKQLIKLPPNPIFDWIFLLSYAVNYMGSENISIVRVAQLGTHTIRGFFYGRKDERANQAEP